MRLRPESIVVRAAPFSPFNLARQQHADMSSISGSAGSAYVDCSVYGDCGLACTMPFE